jgi:hypoxanthine phosphoribosyltransferase
MIPPVPVHKTFVSASELLRDSFRLAAEIHRSGFAPDFIVGIWRGGAPPGIAIQEYFAFAGVNTDHIAVRTSSYAGIGEQSREIRVHGLHYLVENMEAHDSLLVVDDVFDSGRSIEAFLRELRARTRRNMPETVRIACPWYKPRNNRTRLVPDYYLHETDDWLVFPHELCGLTLAEIAAGKPELAGILDILRT